MSDASILGFASGSPFSVAVMRQLARDRRLLAVVKPAPSGGLKHRARQLLSRRPDPLAGLDVPLLSGLEQVANLTPELIVVASFPSILRRELLATARLGAVNLHMSLLPRHRGIDPIFATYWSDDAEGGVTLHWMDEGVDSGDVIVQSAVPLERGLASRTYYQRLSGVGVDLLSSALPDILAGRAPRVAQDAARVTRITAAEIAKARVPLAEWPAERVWHVLSGLGDQWDGLLCDVSHRVVRHGRATGHRASANCEPGRIVTTARGHELHCRDGLVSVEPPARGRGR